MREWILIPSVLLASWALLITISRLWFRRSIGLPLFRRGVIHAVPYSLEEEAARSAGDRRRSLLAHLKEFPENSVPEFVEYLPGLFGIPSKESRGKGEASYWRTSRLHLQLRFDHHLLAERLVDTLVSLYRVGAIKPSEFPSCVRLERIPGLFNRGRYPWRVVIATGHPRVITRWLAQESVQEWLGIGVDLVPALSVNVPDRQNPPEAAPPPPISPPPVAPSPAPPPIRGGGAVAAHGRCREGKDGLEGVVGGIIRNSGRSFAVTCRHVLSTRCDEILRPETEREETERSETGRPPDREFTQDSPDVAFLRENNCFVGSSAQGIAISPVDLDTIEQAVRRETKLSKAPDRDGTMGIVRIAAVYGFKLGAYFYRGLHMEILPHFTKRFGIIWPRSRRFSSQGDSGSWVIDPQSQSWFGMVVGGYEPPQTPTIAIASPYVIDAFTRATGHRSKLTCEALNETRR